MGSTGEFFSMTTEQKKELINAVIEYVNKRVKVYIGTSCMRVEDTIELSNFAIEAGADAVMVIGPYYFALSNESIEDYFDRVANEVKGDIYLYNFPDRTGYDLSPEVTLNLVRKHKNIVGFKDTVTEMGHTRKLITTITKEFPEFVVLSGFDENFVHNIMCGGRGCIGGLSNLCPELFAEWTKAVNEGNLEEIERIQKIVDQLMDLYPIGTPFIPIMKKAMILRGIDIKDYCTIPFLQATEEQTTKIKEVMEKVNELHPPKEEPKEEKPEEKVVDIEAKPEITFDDFAKLQFQVGEVIACEAVKKSKKLLCSQVKIGSQVRQIVSGIKAYYTPEEMVGKKVMVVTNLKPAKLAGILSEGMILCAEDAEGNVCVVSPEKNMPAGSEIC